MTTRRALTDQQVIELQEWKRGSDSYTLKKACDYCDVERHTIWDALNGRNAYDGVGTSETRLYIIQKVCSSLRCHGVRKDTEAKLNRIYKNDISNMRYWDWAIFRGASGKILTNQRPHLWTLEDMELIETNNDWIRSRFS